MPPKMFTQKIVAFLITLAVAYGYSHLLVVWCVADKEDIECGRSIGFEERLLAKVGQELFFDSAAQIMSVFQVPLIT